MPDVQSQTHRTTSVPGAGTIVVGADGSVGAIDAVRWAAGRARAIGARLRLVHAFRESVTATVALPVAAGFATGVTPRRRTARPSRRVVALAVAEARMFAPNIEVSGHVEPGDAVDVLVGASAGAGMLIVGSRGLGRVAGSLTGSIGVQVSAQAHCPTVVVCGEGDADGPVVVAIDGSETSEPALRFAFAEAARRRIGLVAVHAWALPVVAVGPGQAVTQVLATDPARAAARRAASRLMTEVLSPYRSAFPHVDAAELMLESSSEVALSQSTDGAVLAVVGCRGRGRFSGLLFGSTSQAMLAGADCPVAVVRAAEEAG
jgi:nucleotide-binding universal stress UspA family protein